MRMIVKTAGRWPPGVDQYQAPERLQAIEAGIRRM
jgi:hypothetical protein